MSPKSINSFILFFPINNQLSHYKFRVLFWVRPFNNKLFSITFSNWFSLTNVAICQDFKILLQIKSLSLLCISNFQYSNIRYSVKYIILIDNWDLVVKIFSFLLQQRDDMNLGVPVVTNYFPEEEVNIFDNVYLD